MAVIAVVLVVREQGLHQTPVALAVVVAVLIQIQVPKEHPVKVMLAVMGLAIKLQNQLVVAVVLELLG